jgi:hypothetical protein
MAEPRDTTTGDNRTGDQADRRARRDPPRPLQRGGRHDQGIVKDDRGQDQPKDKKRAQENM